MKINIAYLYYDLLNIYGDNGNVLALKKRLKKQRVIVNIDYISLNDKKNFNNYDLIYIGSGTERNILLAFNDLIKYKKELKKYISDNKFILSTGNSFELFGESIKIDKEIYKALNILNFKTEYDLNFRVVKNVLYSCEFLPSKIIGFENHYGKIINNEKYLFEKEGVLKNNFYGTYIIGPILIRNPDFCKYFIEKLILSKDKNYKIKPDDYEYEYFAYNLNLKELKNKTSI